MTIDKVDGKATDTRIAESRGGDFTTEAKVRRNGPTGEFIGTHIGKTTTAFRRVTTAVSIEAEVMRRNSYRWTFQWRFLMGLFIAASLFSCTDHRSYSNNQRPDAGRQDRGALQHGHRSVAAKSRAPRSIAEFNRASQASTLDGSDCPASKG